MALAFSVITQNNNILWAEIVTSNEERQIILVLNIIEILKKFKIFEHHHIYIFGIYLLYVCTSGKYRILLWIRNVICVKINFDDVK